MIRTCIDLCSGLGGFSEAFVKRGWEVVRIDNDPRFEKVPHTRIFDIQLWPEWSRVFFGDHYDIVLASPPCTVFSKASTDRYWIKGRGIPKTWATVEGIRTVMYCLDLIDYIKPRWWVLENPQGMLRHILGMPKVTTYHASWGSLMLKPTDLWGEFPSGISWPAPKNYEKIKHKEHNKNWPRDPALRAKMPYELSEAIAIACEEALKCSET